MNMIIVKEQKKKHSYMEFIAWPFFLYEYPSSMNSKVYSAMKAYSLSLSLSAGVCATSIAPTSVLIQSVHQTAVPMTTPARWKRCRVRSRRGLRSNTSDIVRVSLNSQFIYHKCIHLCSSQRI